MATEPRRFAPELRWYVARTRPRDQAISRRPGRHVLRGPEAAVPSGRCQPLEPGSPRSVGRLAIDADLPVSLRLNLAHLPGAGAISQVDPCHARLMRPHR